MAYPNPLGLRFIKRNAVTKLTDEEVKQARTMHEKEGKHWKEIAAKFNLDDLYARKLLKYEVRSRIYVD